MFQDYQINRYLHIGLSNSIISFDMALPFKQPIETTGIDSWIKDLPSRFVLSISGLIFLRLLDAKLSLESTGLVTSGAGGSGDGLWRLDSSPDGKWNEFSIRTGTSSSSTSMSWANLSINPTSSINRIDSIVLALRTSWFWPRITKRSHQIDRKYLKIGTNISFQFPKLAELKEIVHINLQVQNQIQQQNEDSKQQQSDQKWLIRPFNSRDQFY